MKKPAFRISGKATMEFSATEPVPVDASPLSVDLIDGRQLQVNCDPHGLTRAVMFTTSMGAILRAEERIYCISPGVGEQSYPGVENRLTPEQKMQYVRESNAAPQSPYRLRKLVGDLVAELDASERRALLNSFTKQELAAAVIETFDWDELSHLSASIYEARDGRQEVIAAE